MADVVLTDLPADEAEAYPLLLGHIQALLRGERDPVANTANVAALLGRGLRQVNWVGFYFVRGEELVLGPFAGLPACVRIGFGKGVCGTAWAADATQAVADVHAFPGHIACDAASASELVVPVLREGAVVAVIDLDSPSPARFTAEDAAGIEALAAMLSNRV